MSVVAVTGLGAAGLRVARALVDEDPPTRVALESTRAPAIREACAALGDRAVEWSSSTEPEVVVVATPPGLAHVERVRAEVRRERSVVSLSTSVDDVDALLALDDLAVERGVTVAVGASFSPGLSCVLARHAAGLFDEVHDIHVASVGAGGPRCAESRAESLDGSPVVFVDGARVSPDSTGGPELTWLPDPIGAVDCSLVASPEPVLLGRVWPEARRIDTRWAPYRSLLFGVVPVPTRAAEGELGAVRVEVAGLRGGRLESTTYGVLDRPAVAAGVTAAETAIQLLADDVAPGANGLAAFVDPIRMLRSLRRRGIRAATVEPAV